MPIKVDKKRLIFLLEGTRSSYVLGVDPPGRVRHLYWGSKVQSVSDFELTPVARIDSSDAAIDATQEEYPPHGDLRFKGTALKITQPDGTRDTVFRYDGFSVKKEGRAGTETLVLHLVDTDYPTKINLCYRIFEEHDIIERWVEVSNTSAEDLILENVQSAVFCFPGTNYFSSQVSGHWSSEQCRFREKLSPGKRVFESRKGVTGNNHTPYFMLDRAATEEGGEVFFGALAYSGNWVVTVETTQFDYVSVSLGVNSYDFSYSLKPNQTFSSPAVFAGYGKEGFAEVTHRMNRFYSERLAPRSHRKATYPVLFNSWEATKFDISVKQQLALAERAAQVGVELFVVDDGWFGTRDGEKAGLGDWFPNKRKFPNGLQELISKVNKLGMKFGLWIEPEMVNPDSELYRRHPDWIYNFPKRTPTQARFQHVLNLTRKDVQEHLRRVLDTLLTENNIEYVKWDMNRSISEGGTTNLEDGDWRSVWYRHTQAFYELARYLRKRHPRVTFEVCAAGGSRLDYGSLQIFDQVWVSDNTDAVDRLLIQEGYSYLYPIRAMRAWVTDVPNKITQKSAPLRFRFHVAMSGILGLGGNLSEYSAEDLELCREQVAVYKRIRDVVQRGDVYRIESISRAPFHAVQYVNGQQSIVFVYSRAQPFINSKVRFRVRGLAANKTYSINYEGVSLKRTGAYLMNVGLELDLKGDFVSCVIELEA
jgi:alpha-galactosidase